MNVQSRHRSVADSPLPTRSEPRTDMRLGLLASSFLMLATASANAGNGPALIQASGGLGLWSTAASLATGREEHIATLLPNGKVLVAGGTDGRGKGLASAELYHPGRNRWPSAGCKGAAPHDQTATPLEM